MTSLSLYVIITSITSILINSNIIPSSSTRIDFILAISIIVIGYKWLYNIVLAFFERKVEKMLNFTIYPPKSSECMIISQFNLIIYTMEFIFLKPTLEIVVAILTIYYIISKRLYLIICDDEFTLDDYDRVSFFGNKEMIKLYKVRFFGNKESRRDKYGTIKLLKKLIREFSIRLGNSFYACILLIWLILTLSHYNYLYLIYLIINILPNKSTSSCDKSQSEEDIEKNKEKEIIIYNHKLAKKLDLGDPMNIIEKYIIYISKLGLRMETEYQFKIESIEITEKQRDELRKLLCGLVQYSYTAEEKC
ncbi:hypothetical protein C2G38_2074659 [Gigaspora rosea]|uniref:Uncharacterized protein n=1 Tax=Gigaspora rosea TaxID=44941 RepID=A0A397VLR5_9GLOM|nr:hypothetical protein C2G38_2074659 [Gigaspora rosea]